MDSSPCIAGTQNPSLPHVRTVICLIYIVGSQFCVVYQRSAGAGEYWVPSTHRSISAMIIHSISGMPAEREHLLQAEVKHHVYKRDPAQDLCPVAVKLQWGKWQVVKNTIRIPRWCHYWPSYKNSICLAVSGFNIIHLTQKKYAKRRLHVFLEQPFFKNSIVYLWNGASELLKTIRKQLNNVILRKFMIS